MAPARPGARWGAAGLLAVAAGAAALVYFVDPAAGAWFYPRCPLLTLTGLECPGCGSTRAVHRLLHGELGAALALNPLLAVYLPILGYGLADRLSVVFRGRGLAPLRLGAVPILALAAVVVGFGIVRNL